MGPRNTDASSHELTVIAVMHVELEPLALHAWPDMTPDMAAELSPRPSHELARSDSASEPQALRQMSGQTPQVEPPS
jgi:hypothetical protein